MNFFLEQSINYAQQRCYLDDLYSVYPTIPNSIRDIDKKIWDNVEIAYKERDYKDLLINLLKLDLFPIKDSYVAFLKRDYGALDRNPRTLNRLASEILEMDLNVLYDKCSTPKESNRQIGPMFKKWIKKTDFGFPKLEINDFENSNDDAILDGSDFELKQFAQEHLNYNHNKGLDFVARVKGKYVIGEAKFLTDFGGHQNAQYNDAISTIECDADAVKIAILDGVLYINNRSKMYKDINGRHSESNIMSALLLKNFLYSI